MGSYLRHIIILTFLLIPPIMYGQSHELDNISPMNLMNHLDADKCLQGNCLNGKGTFFFNKNRALYKGMFRHGRPNGYGTCSYENGEYYQGHWQDGYFHKEGILSLSNGQRLKGSWEMGRLIKLLHEEPQVKYHNEQSRLGQTYALIVGVSDYPSMPNLKYADDDALKMYSHLRSELGGKVSRENIYLLIEEEATRSRIEMAMVELQQRMNSDDHLLIFFSGHGLKEAFLPYDYDGFDQVISHERIANFLDHSPASMNVLIADACHSGTGLRAKGSSGYQMSFDKFLGKGCLVLLSSGQDETSMESDGLKQGVFSHFLFEGLTGKADTNRDSSVTIGELYHFVFKHVVHYTSGLQHPVIEGDYSRDEVIAERTRF